MIVRMNSNYAGPHGTCAAGCLINLDRSEAKELIAMGYAKPEKGTTEERTVNEPEKETAEAAPTTETVPHPSRPRRGRRPK